ncbi:retrovirus-related Pol polyprotein from transposon TNT 1-94 [Trichonephila clavata]|uniref:Retrovirus-related Pol polyprotein from transposon TNT 1-94 n=1 Tax=Trichonephila clavata TaxID=2740835 RepID=A0A8X6KD21_TRICU|nr:retrovirus-related Pol polyprotein from transposon TNT 1-94 [Trichonephila clavata]
MLHGRKKGSILQWYNTLKEGDVTSLAQFTDGSLFYDIVTSLNSTNSPKENITTDSTEPMNVNVGQINTTNEETVKAGQSVSQIAVSDSPEVGEKGNIDSEKKYDSVKKFIDDIFQMDSTSLINYSECLKGNELELAKVAVFLLVTLVQNLLFTNIELTKPLFQLDSQVQEDIQEFLSFVLADRSQDDGPIKKSEFHKILSRSAGAPRQRQHSRSGSTDHNEASEGGKKTSKKRKGRASSIVYEDNQDSSIKTLLESPKFQQKVAMYGKESELKKLRNALYMEENKVLDLLTEKKTLNGKLEKKNKEVECLKDEFRKYREEAEESECFKLKEAKKQDEEIKCLKKVNHSLKEENDKLKQENETLDNKVEELELKQIIPFQNWKVNYVSWANDVKYLLMERQVWNIVDEKEIEPKLDASTDAEAVKEVKNFKARKQIAMSIIYLNIDSSHRRIVERIDDPVEAWKVLKTYYQPDSKAHHMEVYSSLMNCNILSEESISLFSTRLLRIYEQLRDLDEDFSERYVTFQLLRYLPPQFDSIVQTILRLDDVKFVYKDVVAELVAEEARLKLRNMDMNKEIAAQSPRMVSKKRSIKTCYQCKSPDHLKKNCLELTSRRTTMKNSYRSLRCHFTPRNVKGSYQHGKRCQSPTRQRQSRNNHRCSNHTPNQRNNFHHRDVSPETVLEPQKRITFEASALMDKKLEFWHKRLAHVSPSVISRTVKENGARGLPNFKNLELKCEPCQLNKQRRVSFKRQEGIRSRRPLDLLYGDVWGPCNKIATPESSEDETDEDSPDTHKPSTKTVNWFRKLVPRPDGNRMDVYYYQEGCTKRLRTLKDIEKYCKDHNLTFDSDIFNFSQSDMFHGVIDGSKGTQVQVLVEHDYMT